MTEAAMLAAGFAAGAVCGWLYCLALWRATRRAMASGGVGRLLGGMALRLGLAAAAVGGAAAAGATPGQLLAGAAGFTVVRLILVRRIGEGAGWS